MDSSRSGLLSTILMTLPLIVVPAVALLRPPGSVSGVSTAELSASEDEDVDAIFDDFDGFDAEPSNGFLEKIRPNAAAKAGPSAEEFLFEDPLEESPRVAENRSEQPKAAPRPDSAASDPFIERTVPQPPTPELQKSAPPGAASDPAVPEPVTSSVQKMVDQLNTLGALRTLWFDASDNAPVGFAAFFRGQTELTRIRFEAVGQSREDCVRNVLEQVNRWQQQN